MSSIGPADGIMLRGRLSRLLLDAWFAARGRKLLPSREMIRPSALTKAMPLMVILDYRSPEDVVCLMTGTRIREFLGVELTGLNIHDLVRGETRKRRQRRFQLCAEQPCGMAAVMPIAIGEAAPREFEFLMLPVTAGKGLQFFAIASALGEEIELPRGEYARESSPLAQLADELRFVNLGAGVPSETP